MQRDPLDDTGPALPDCEEQAARTYVTLALGDQLCAIDVSNVREILDLLPMSELPGASREVVGLVDLRGQAIPVVDLAMRLGVRRAGDATGGRILIVEASPDAPPLGLRVDRVESVIEIEPTAVEPPPDALRGWDRGTMAGVTRLDGRLTFLLAPTAVLDRREQAPGTVPMAAARRAAS